jgi:hypothetical protein
VDIIKVSRVFVPGGLPRHTYVPRSNRGLEVDLRRSADDSCKLVTVTGATKSGKTVLTQTMFPRGEAIWLDGGSYGSESELWSDVLDHLDEFTDVAVTRSHSTDAGLSASAGIEINVGVAKAEFGVQPSISQGREAGSTTSRSRPAKATAVAALRESQIPLVIDDFHYLEREIQAAVVRALKSLIFDGQTVILLAIPHRRFDAVRVEKEMTGRVAQLGVPPWEVDELLEIPRIGFPLLNMVVPLAILEGFAAEATSR